MMILLKLALLELNSTIQKDVGIGSHNTQKRLEGVVSGTRWHENALHAAKTLGASVYNAIFLFVIQSTIMDQQLPMEEIVSSINTFKT